METASYPPEKSKSSSQMTSILVDTYSKSEAFEIARAQAEEFISQQFQVPKNCEGTHLLPASPDEHEYCEQFTSHFEL
jgi:hypothetical protein